jgi:hypothetical protein
MKKIRILLFGIAAALILLSCNNDKNANTADSKIRSHHRGLTMITPASH